MDIEAFFDDDTWTLTYVVSDPDTREAVVIDPVLDYDPVGSQTATRSVDEVAAYVERRGLTLRWILETHAHADHLSGSQLLKRRFGARIAIGRDITVVQETFKELFDLPDAFATDGSQFDRLLTHGETLKVGNLRIRVLSTPGHTPACVSYLIGDAVFTGDALFMEDYGTGRCDFPRGDATAMYRSVHDVLYALPDDTRVFVGHDYQPNGRPLRYETTIGVEKEQNRQLRASTPERDFVELRNTRDAKLKAPRLLFPSVQVNIDAGRLPAARENGVRYLRIPLNLKSPTDEAGQRSEPEVPAGRAAE
jgi:glyoxylase-like metal-dependent hydrolase (beta-lactamase superfamily II)